MSNPTERNREQEDAVIEARTAGESYRSIAKRLGVSHVRVIHVWQRHLRELAIREAAWREDLAAINVEMDHVCGEICDTCDDRRKDSPLANLHDNTCAAVCLKPEHRGLPPAIEATERPS